ETSRITKRTAEYRKRITNFEGWNRFALSFFKSTEYLHSMFDVRCSFVSFPIKLAAFQAGGWAEL
ncbi:MAG: hypothetical protein KJP23_05420, partial [Deltaproteobacteria bacterium]|nr:hypothetical protein [Deltaproteobacteria bacterium]